MNDKTIKMSDYVLEQQLLREKFGYTKSELNILAKKESGS